MIKYSIPNIYYVQIIKYIYFIIKKKLLNFFKTKNIVLL